MAKVTCPVEIEFVDPEGGGYPGQPGLFLERIQSVRDVFEETEGIYQEVVANPASRLAVRQSRVETAIFVGLWKNREATQNATAGDEKTAVPEISRTCTGAAVCKNEGLEKSLCILNTRCHEYNFLIFSKNHEF